MRIGLLLALFILSHLASPQAKAQASSQASAQSTAQSSGQPQKSKTPAQELQELRERVQTLETSQQQNVQSLTDEVANLKMNLAIPELTKQSFYGLGIGASKVYYSKSPLSIGGYGESYFVDKRGGPNTTEMYRFVPYIGFRFNKNIIFNSEIEFEHGGAEDGKGDAKIEFAYLDFLLSPQANIRVGHVLVPVGFINFSHEPIYFPMVFRPDIERYLIPSTWHENGALFFGSVSDLTYYVGTVNAGNSENFTKDSWIKEGRQGGSEDSKAENWAQVARLDYRGITGLLLGGSYYQSDSSQDNKLLGHSSVTLWDVHTQFQAKGLQVTALYTKGRLTDVSKINSFKAAEASSETDPGKQAELIAQANVASEVEGWYTVASYDVLGALGLVTESTLPLFISYENYDLQKAVGAGQVRDRSLSRQVTSLGMNYRPITNVTLKADYQFRKVASGGGETDKLEFGLGWVF